jgi:3-phosphoshikimate 1-carboxyvinyltransferase
VPGDKSISHRALILGGMAEGETVIEGLLESQDVLHTAAAVRALGAEVERENATWRVRGGPWRSPSQPIDCGNSGTAVRLLMGAVAGQAVVAAFTGDASLQKRPMGRVTGPLQQMGATIEGGDRLPIRIGGGGLRGISYAAPTSSAQVKSAILLAGLGAEGRVEVTEPRASRDHTERMLPLFGVAVETDGATEPRRVALGAVRKMRGARISVPGDPSSAAFPIVAALVTLDSRIELPGVLVNPLRAGLFETLREMGARIELRNGRTVCGEPIADIHVQTSALRGVTVPAARAPAMIDEYPILAVAAAFATGETIMHGLAELRVKESDRLAAVVSGLTACGVAARAEGDSLIVQGCGGPPPGGGDVATHGDHRIAMAFLVLGLGANKPVTVDEADMIATSFPGFAELMRGLGAQIGTTP